MTDRLLDGRGVIVPAAGISLVLAFAAARSPLLALAAVGAVLLLLFVFVWAEAVLLVLLAALPWEDLLQYPTETVTAVKLFGLMLLGAWAFRVLQRGSQLRLPGTLVPVVGLGLTIGLSLVLSPDPSAGVAKVLRYALFIVFFFLIVQLTTSRISIKRVLRVLSLSATGAALWALVAFLSGELERAGGPISDPNDFAYLIATVLPLTAYLWIEDRGRRAVWASCFALQAAAMLATLSRGALVGLGALAVWAIATRRVPVVGVLAAIGTLVGVVLVALTFWSPLINERVESKEKVQSQNTASRLTFWDAALRMSYDHPLTGVGPDRFSQEAESYARGTTSGIEQPVAHNSYLEILAENGFLALIFFVAYIVGSWALLARARAASLMDADAEGVRLATALQAAFVVAVVGAFFLSQQLALPLWLVGALGAALAPGLGAAAARFAPPRAVPLGPSAAA
jgi:putative inorganic carbon (hco3(-)) transporter